MSLYLFNSFSRSKEKFKPINPDRVSLYVCGITPNNAIHLGHAFTFVSFDVLVRFLQYKKYKVEYLQNATDINDSDDVIKQALDEGRTWEEEAAYWINDFHTQTDRINILRPNKYVLATQVMDKIIERNSDLIKKGFVYEKDGNVYFEISKFAKYGKLSRFTPEQMLLISKERGNNIADPHKKNPLDFVLWLNVDQTPTWESPWGRGRPGWHIECSTIILDSLGEQIDIHGGGRDLIYPHHESEIAQSESLTGKKFVNTWMHTAMVLCEGEKMSKSLGNLVLVEDLLKKYSPNAIRWILLSHHYREPWEYEEYELEQIEKKVKKINEALSKVISEELEVGSQFEELMNNDLQTPKVLELVDSLLDQNKLVEANNILKVLGFRL